MNHPKDFETLFSLMYTLYSAPNMISPFFGGYFVDKIGSRACILICVIVVGVGQAVFLFGLAVKNWLFILLGRLIFGFGGENLTVVSSAMLSEWFFDQGLALSFGIFLSIGKFGSVVNNLLSPSIASSSDVIIAAFFGLLLCGMSLFFTLITISMDRYMDMKKVLNRQLLLPSEDFDEFHKDQKEFISNLGKPREYDNDDDRLSAIKFIQPKFSDIYSFNKMYWLLIISVMLVYACVLPFNNISMTLLLERDYFTSPPSHCKLTNPQLCQSDNNPPNSYCSNSRWVQPPLPSNVNVSGHFYHGQVTANDIDCFQNKWASSSHGCTYDYCHQLSQSEIKASIIMSIPYITAIFATPLFGLGVDRIGMRGLLCVLSPMVFLIVHVILGFTSIDPVGPLIGQGLAYALFVSAIWPSIPLVVEQRVLGLGFGVLACVQNFSCAVIPPMIATIYLHSDNHYIPNVEILFISLSAAGVVIGVIDNIVDYYCNKSILNSSELSSNQLQSLRIPSTCRPLIYP
jgi:MFS family permease